MVYKSIVYIVVACGAAYIQGNVIKNKHGPSADIIAITQFLLFALTIYSIVPMFLGKS